MKKIYSILLTTVIGLAGLLTACTFDYPAGPMARNISVSPAEVQTAAAGETFEATVTADGSWVADTPDWITVSPKRGDGGETVRVTVAANEGKERTDKVKFYSAVGGTSTTSVDLDDTPLAELTVKQEASEGQGGGEEAQTISIADYLALGENADPYIISGVITRVANTNYGNFDLTDETGTVYVYGLLTEDLESQKCWKDNGLAMGDALTVKANNLQLYKGTTWEIVDAVYVSHTKSLIDIDAESVTVAKEGGDFAVKATVKGENIKVDYDADWITFNGATKEGEEVTLNFTSAPNEGEPRSAVMTLSTSTAKGDSSTKEFTVKQEGSVLTKTVSEILQLELNADVQSSVSLVSAVTARGFVATDGVKAVYVYTQGTDFNGIAKVGDNVRFSGSKTVYSGVHEVQNITALEVVSSGNAVVYPTATDVTADALTYTADEAVYVSLVGTLAKSGNFYNITLDGIDPGTKQGSIVYPTADLGADALDGKKIKVTGYFNGLSSGGKYLNIIATSVEAVE